MIALVSHEPLDATFRVADISACRADLGRRREVKAVLHYADLAALQRLLETNGRRQVFHRAVSTVRSVYFDDARLSACRANLDGLGRRSKLRLRWYDCPLPGREAYLEIKWRCNRITGKRRLRVESDDVLGAMTYRELAARLTAAVPEDFLPALVRAPEPTVLVEYQREHFVSDDRRVRVTLDYGLVYYAQTGKQRISTAFGRRNDGLLVLEGKTAVGCEGELRSLLHPFSARVARCSKYVDGCRLLGLIDD